jgi:glyoxylase-like metal-dependent hydrolase (beta-lactamase superfamily II)/rhodanese-related sulfurtransferase
MKIQQIYTKCLSQASYYIESNGEAAIIDPLRETAEILALAKNDNAQIKYIFETHFHADFISGHLDFADKTNAPIVFGPGAKAKFKFHEAFDGEEFTLGKIKIQLIHTPGHTLESSCLLILDEEGKQHALFTGDTLFLGDVGRPDLAIKSDLTEKDLAKLLYNSLYHKILPLDENVLLYPGHGAGSSCGKKLSSDTMGTLIDQKKTNYALQNLTEENFVNQILNGLQKPPQYFPKNVVKNMGEHQLLDDVLKRGNTPISIEDFKVKIKETDILLIDTRAPSEFHKGFIEGSINIGIAGGFASWVGQLIEDLNQKIMFISEPGKEIEVITRFARVGYDNTIGFLEGGYSNWVAKQQPIDTLQSISAKEFLSSLSPTDITLDIRERNEFQKEHFTHTTVENAPLAFLSQNLTSLDINQKYFIHCAGGYRSMIASSILKANGFQNITNIEGGFGAMKSDGFPISTNITSNIGS